MDACFCLKWKIVSSDEKDPGLGTGFAYFVEDPPYQEYYKTLGDQTEMNSCTGLSAVDHANMRFLRGYAITGVGLGLCARHELVAKNGAGDIQKGEKYGNMTYIFASMLRLLLTVLSIVLSYDINFRRHFEHVLLGHTETAHHGHKIFCQQEFSLNYMFGVGRTDGEGVEQPWVNIGPVAMSTREMGPGHRHDMLDDHWHNWNWRKIVALRKLLARRCVEAADERLVQEEAYADFSNSQLAQLPSWREKVEAWEVDPSQLNPYKQEGSSITLQEVRLQLAQNNSILASTGLPAVHEVSPAEFMIMALDAKDQQQRLKQEIKRFKASGTTKQTANLIEKRNKVTCQISCLQPLQSMYMAASVQILADLAKAVGKDGLPLPAPAAEDVCILFPSDLTEEQRSQGIWPALEDIESQLRDAQCRDALNELRNHLIVKSQLLTYKIIHARHQGATTRSQGLLERNQTKITLSARRYQ
ncbi:hypothetical protein C8J56DRAFT_1067883 [Mycena floridula]|nr:hypothetical protein C8J56DRAFT_1067883 [Mycena floridula]